MGDIHFGKLHSAEGVHRDRGSGNHGLGALPAERLRIGVPGQLAVMGFADLPIAASVEPRLTSIQVRAIGMGMLAGQMLLGQLRGEPPRERVVDLGYAVVERAST